MKQISILAAGLLLAATARAGYRLPVGESAVYRIQWGPLHCGTSTIRCEEVELGGERLVRVRVRVQSNWLVSTLYPVDDTVDCYIDPETMQSIRLEKCTSEGGFVCRDVLEFDRTNNVARWTSHSDNISTNYPIPPGACDAVSFIYAFRRHAFEEAESRSFPLVVDTRVHGIAVRATERDGKKVGGIGRVPCLRYGVEPERDDLFVRKIPQAIWLTDDDRKILVRMDVQVPVGRARIVLDQYTPPD